MVQSIFIILSRHCGATTLRLTVTAMVLDSIPTWSNELFSFSRSNNGTHYGVDFHYSTHNILKKYLFLRTQYLSVELILLLLLFIYFI